MSARQRCRPQRPATARSPSRPERSASPAAAPSRVALAAGLGLTRWSSDPIWLAVVVWAWAAVVIVLAPDMRLGVSVGLVATGVALTGAARAPGMHTLLGGTDAFWVLAFILLPVAVLELGMELPDRHRHTRVRCWVLSGAVATGTAVSIASINADDGRGEVLFVLVAAAVLGGALDVGWAYPRSSLAGRQRVQWLAAVGAIVVAVTIALGRHSARWSMPGCGRSHCGRRSSSFPSSWPGPRQPRERRLVARLSPSRRGPPRWWQPSADRSCLSLPG